MIPLSWPRRWLKRIHPESIPAAGTFFYDRISRSDVFQRHYDIVASDILSYCSQGSILDIGTGPGWLLIKLREKAPDLQLTGLDISPSMVGKARAHVATADRGREIQIVQGSASQLPFQDNLFDAVVSTGSLHHWKDPSASLNEIWRVLKPGGTGLIYDLVSDTPESILRDMALQFGRLRMILLWVHAFEEPFYRWKDMLLLAAPTRFKEGHTKFVGVLCCLILSKPAERI